MNPANPTQPQTWLGQSYVVYTHLAAQQNNCPSHRVIAAAWCETEVDFDEALRLHLIPLGLTLLYSRGVQPAEQGLTPFTDPKDQAEAQRLAEKIGPDQTTAISYLYAVEPETATETQSYLKIETLEGIEPLDGQVGVYPRKTVPDKLYEPLFGQPEPTEEEIERYGGKENIPPMKLYAILDAAKVKTPGLRTMLRTSGLDFACLFTGQDYETLKDSAPYIVELKEDSNFTRILFTYDPKMPDEHLTAHLWHKEPGIYIRSRASLIELGQHFARFVRVRDEKGKRYIFRFWEPNVAPYYFDSIKTILEKCAQWMVMRNSGRVERIIANSTGNKSVWVFSPDWNKLEGFTSVGASTLSDMEMAAFVEYKRERFIEELLPYFKKKDAFHVEAIGDDGLKKVIRLGMGKAAIYGLTRRSPVKLYIQMMMYLGSYFDEDPVLSWTRDILKSEKFGDAQADKANALRGGLIEYLETVSGKQGEYLQSFMRACQSELDKTEKQVSSDTILSFVQLNYPQKYQYTGGEAMAQLVGHSKQLCDTHGLDEDRSVLSLTCLCLVYGTRMIDDPLFPWMKKVFEANASKTKKDELFYKVTRSFLSKVVQYVEGGN